MKSPSLDSLVAQWGALIMLAVFLPVAIFVTTNSIISADRLVAGRGDALAASLAREAAEPLLTGDGISVSRILNRAVASHEDVFYVCLENREGRVVAHTFRNGIPGDVASIIGLHRENSLMRFRSSRGAGLNTVAGVMDGELGRIHVGISRQSSVAARNRSLMFMGAALVGALSLVFVSANVISRRVSMPLRELEKAVARFPDDGTDSNNFNVSGTAEVVSLSNHFADLAGKMRELETERKATLERMVNAERLAAVGEMVSGLVHEVRNPVDGMLECVAYLEEDRDISERARKFYPMIKDGLERINRIMRDMLSFVRPDKPGKPRNYAMGEVFDSLALMVERNLEGRNIKLDWSRPGGCACFCDADAVVQAALNLILNAAEAAEGSALSEVKVEASCNGNKVYLVVDDSGPGVDEVLRDKIFDPFVTGKPPGKGTGLGLSVSRQLIRANGGDIKLAAERGALGGARFVIELPRIS